MPGEGLTLLSHDGITRKVRKQLRELEVLMQGDLRDAQSIHRLRRHTKKLRAWLALLDPDDASRKYRKAAHCLCSLARAFGRQRDGQVLLDTLDGLAAPGAFPLCRHLLQTSLQDAMAALPQEQVLEGGKLQRTFAVLHASTALETDERSLRRGLRHSYRRARLLYGKAVATGEHEHFHRLRRWIKHLAAQMELVVLCRSGHAHQRLKTLTELGNLLGKFHDLDVFRLQLQTLTTEVGAAPGLAEEVAALQQRALAAETGLLAKARPLAAHCLAEKPKRFSAAQGTR